MPRRTYPDAFKQGVIRRLNTGVSIRDASREFNVPPCLLYRWRRQSRRNSLFPNPVPLWWFFTTLYGTIIGANFTKFVDQLYYQNILDLEGWIRVIGFSLSLGVLISDWVWTSVILANYPRSYDYFYRFEQISSKGKAWLLFMHTAYIVLMGISLSLVSKYPWPVLNFDVMDNPTWWFFLSMVAAIIWDLSSYVSKLFIPRFNLYWIGYWLSMGGIALVFLSFFLGFPRIHVIIHLDEYQRFAFIVSLAVVVFWRTISLRLARN